MLLKSKSTHRALASCVLAGVIAGGAVACRQPAPQPRAVRSHDIKLPRELTTVASQVPANATLPEILATHRIRPEHGTKFLQALTGVFDVRDLKAHHPYQIELTLDGWLRAFRYQIDTDRFLQVSIPPATATPAPAPPDTVFTAEVMPYRKERALVAVRGTIDEKNNSLVAAMDAAGEQIQLAIGLAEIFGGDIDFGHDLQPGDSFEVVFEQVVKEGARAGYGEIIAATFTNDGKTYSAFRYQVPGGKPGYYDEQGRSLKRFFLASPLKFEPRVTSGFSYRRLHPVLGIRRPHLGVDFGAPRGAPVVAVSDGTVVSAAFTRGGGNTVTLRHTERLRNAVPAPVVVRHRHPRRRPRLPRPGHRPRRRHRPRDRSASALRAETKRPARQPARRTPPPSARRPDQRRAPRGVREGQSRSARALRQRFPHPDSIEVGGRAARLRTHARTRTSPPPA